ncbi:hypothetical protein [Cellulosilyticum ruminicola]|uniref:hypothetical protein n=1 Tax=Cellulosilyticum ruminicola TaxID=425254 RepID=UPI0012EDDC14|nr:hypothetical protein [Cellulosilyticum ruminicola]
MKFKINSCFEQVAYEESIQQGYLSLIDNKISMQPLEEKLELNGIFLEKGCGLNESYSSRPEKENVSVIYFDKNYKIISEAFAKWNGYAVVKLDNVEELSQLFVNEYLIFVGSPDYFNFRWINKVNKIQSATKKFYYGIITGRNYESLTHQILYHTLMSKSKEAHILNYMRIENSEGVEQDEKSLNAYGDQCNYANLKEYSKAYNICTINAHGGDCMVYISDGVLCAKTNCLKKDEYKNDIMPACYQGYECFKNTKVFSPEGLMYDHYFINSCFSLKPAECIFNDAYNLAFRFLDTNILSYIGSIFIIEERVLLNYLYSAMWKSGYTLGHINYTINRTYNDTLGGPDSPFTLIGNPIIKNSETIAPVIHEMMQLESVDLSIKETAIIKIKVAGTDIREQFFSGKVRISVMTDKKLPIYAAFNDVGDEIWLFSKLLITDDVVHLKVLPGKPFNLGIIRNLERFEKFKVGVEKFDVYMKDIKKITINFQTLIKDYLWKISENSKVYKKQDRWLEYFNLIQKSIINKLAKRIHEDGFSYEEALMGNSLCYKDYTELDEKCRACNSDLALISYSCSIDETLEMLMKICPKCGVVHVIPRDIQEQGLYIEPLQNYRMTLGETQEIKVWIHNNSEEEYFGYVALSVKKGKNIGAQYSELQEISLLPKEKKVFTFTVQISEEGIPFCYLAKVIAIVNGAICISGGNLIIWDL